MARAVPPALVETRRCARTPSRPHGSNSAHKSQDKETMMTTARVQKKDGDQWGLILVRELRHTPEIVWEAITDPAHLREWAPFDADGSLGNAGSKVKLTTVGAPSPHVTETTVTKAEPPTLLVYNWGGNDMRWELERVG